MWIIPQCRKARTIGIEKTQALIRPDPDILLPVLEERSTFDIVLKGITVAGKRFDIAELFCVIIKPEQPCIRSCKPEIPVIIFKYVTEPATGGPAVVLLTDDIIHRKCFDCLCAGIIAI